MDFQRECEEEPDYEHHARPGFPIQRQPISVLIECPDTLAHNGQLFSSIQPRRDALLPLEGFAESGSGLVADPPGNLIEIISPLTKASQNGSL